MQSQFHQDFCEEPPPPRRANGRRKPLPVDGLMRALVAEISGSRPTRAEVLAAAANVAAALDLSLAADLVIKVMASCFGEQHLSQGIMVWPSNAYLLEKTGLSDRGVRNAILELRVAAVILAEDSANGKRYPRKKCGEIIGAFGFNLAPLIARAEEFAEILADRKAEQAVCLDVRANIGAARSECFAIRDKLLASEAVGQADELTEALAQSKPPRSERTRSRDLEALLIAAEALRDRARRLISETAKASKDAANGGAKCRHIESNTESSTEGCQSDRGGGVEALQHSSPGTIASGLGRAPPVLEANAVGSRGLGACEEENGDRLRHRERWRKPGPADRDPGPPIDELQLWRTACPILADAGLPPDFSSKDLINAGHRFSHQLGIAAHGRKKHLDRLGPVRYALLAVGIAQIVSDDAARNGTLRNPGGLFCKRAAELAAGRFSLETEVRNLYRKRQNRQTALRRRVH